jgi:hypothetical protein
VKDENDLLADSHNILNRWDEITEDQCAFRHSADVREKMGVQ